MNQKGDTPARLAIRSHDDECAELHRIMTGKRENTGSRGRLARMVRLSESTVRDYLNGRIKHGASFVAACHAATDGDPEIAEMITPPGFMLMAKPDRSNPLANIEQELGDVHSCTGRLHHEVRQALEDELLDATELSSLKRRIHKGIEELLDVERFLDAVFEGGGRLPSK
jgi:hypothetical protein